MSGVVGIALSIVLCFEFESKKPESPIYDDKEADLNKNLIAKESIRYKMKQYLQMLRNPHVLFLLVGGVLRHTASLSWAFNQLIYFDETLDQGQYDIS